MTLILKRARAMLPTNVILVILCSALAVACSKQAEGERCDTNNGSLDCDDGLICRSEAEGQLAIRGRGIALCCPPDDVAPSVDACRAGAQLPEEELPPAPSTDAGDGGN
jgi:hypothetical protein